MNTIPGLLDKAYTNWNDAERLGAIGAEFELRSRLVLARKILQRALTLEPVKHPEWYASLAFAYFRDIGKYEEEGEKTFIEGIEATDSDFLKALYISFLEDEEAAHGLIESLKTSNDLSVRLTLGQALLWRGRQSEAVDLLRSTIKEVPEGETPLGLDSYCSSMNWMRAQGLQIDLEQEVFPYIERLIASNPDSYAYYSLKVQMYQILENWEKVCDTAKEVLRVIPDEETTMFALAGAYEKLEDDELAKTWYNRAIGAKPSYVRARIQLGRLYERQGNTELAEIIFREIPAAHPDYHMGKLSLAYFLQRSGNSQEAFNLFNEAYPRLKPYEKGSIEKHPEGKLLLDRMNAVSLN